MDLKKYIAELKKRHVIKAGLAYLIGAWVFTEVSALVLDSFEAPAIVMKTMLVILAIGFPSGWSFRGYMILPRKELRRPAIRINQFKISQNRPSPQPGDYRIFVNRRPLTACKSI